MFWADLEKNSGAVIPICVKNILTFAAYDNISSLMCLSENAIKEVEEYISEFGRSVIHDLYCCHSDKYKKQTNFKFLPGHRSILSLLQSYAKKQSESVIQISSSESNVREKYSTVLAELISSYETNSKKHKNHARYTDFMKDFFTYVYLICGKYGYETLQKNLPIPSTKSICEYKILTIV